MSEWEIHTPIDTFVHPDTSSQIDLVSMVHVGLPSYYRAVGNHIITRQAEGFAVHYELIDDEVGPDAKPDNLKAKIRDATLDLAADCDVLFLLHTDYVMQDTLKLFAPERSNNHDITETAMVAQLNRLDLVKSYASARIDRHKFRKAAAEGPEVLDELVFTLLKTGVRKAMQDRVRSKGRDKVMIQARNQIALEAVDATLTEDAAAKLVLVWGLGHRAGLQSGLFDRGYEHTGTQEVQLADNDARFDRHRQQLEKTIQKSQKRLDRLKAEEARRRATEASD